MEAIFFQQLTGKMKFLSQLIRYFTLYNILAERISVRVMRGLRYLVPGYRVSCPMRTEDGVWRIV